MTLNDTVSVIRNVARLNLRVLAVNELRAELLDATNRLTEHRKRFETAIANHTKTSDIAKFNLAQLADEDPEKEEKTKRFEKTIATCAEEITQTQKTNAVSTETYKKEIDEINAHITQVESGETKMSKKDLQTESVRLLNALGKQNAEDAMKKAFADESDF